MWVLILITHGILSTQIVSIHAVLPIIKVNTRIPSYQRPKHPFSFITSTSQSHALISQLPFSSLLNIRGGADVAVESDEKEDDEEGEGSNGTNEEESEDEDEDEDEDEQEDNDQSENEDEDVDKDSTAPSFGPPIQVQIRTNLNVPIIDQSLEFTASQKRDIASIKLSISRQMRGRPPVSSQRILLGTRVVQDDELIADLLEEWEEEHDMGDEDDDDDDNDNDNDDDDIAIDKETVLPLTLDIPPPIDPKFATELKNQFKSSNVHQLLDAYVYNMAVLHRNTQQIFEEQKLETSSTFEQEDEEEKDKDEEHDDEEKDENETDDMTESETIFLPESILLRQHAQLLREQLKSTFTEETLQKLEEFENTINDEIKEDENDNDNDIREGGTTQTGIYIGSGLGVINEQKSSLRGGAKMTFKRVLQRNLNIHWPDTIRNTLLFLFFGHFGAKSQSSRLLMMSMAPLCFLLQFRPIKILIKQLFYAIGKPPAILLSLLPAPQQKIMGLDTGLYMRDIYGEDDENHLGVPVDDDDDNDNDDNDDDYDLGDENDYDDVDDDDEYDDEDSY